MYVLISSLQNKRFFYILMNSQNVFLREKQEQKSKFFSKKIYIYFFCICLYIELNFLFEILYSRYRIKTIFMYKYSYYNIMHFQRRYTFSPKYINLAVLNIIKSSLSFCNGVCAVPDKIESHYVSFNLMKLVHSSYTTF